MTLELCQVLLSSATVFIWWKNEHYEIIAWGNRRSETGREETYNTICHSFLIRQLCWEDAVYREHSLSYKSLLSALTLSFPVNGFWTIILASVSQTLFHLWYYNHTFSSIFTLITSDITTKQPTRYSRAELRVQIARCLTHKPEDLALIPSICEKNHVVAFACNSSTEETEAGGSLGFTGQLVQSSWSVPSQWEIPTPFTQSGLLLSNSAHGCPFVYTSEHAHAHTQTHSYN